MEGHTREVEQDDTKGKVTRSRSTNSSVDQYLSLVIESPVVVVSPALLAPWIADSSPCDLPRHIVCLCHVS